MRNDHIFVLLLVVLLPMSGCFGDAVGGAEGESESTIVNNYYNTTTPQSEMFALGGLIYSTTNVDPDNSRRYYPDFFNSSIGEAVVIHEADTSSNSSMVSVYIITECENGESWSNMPGDNYQLYPFILPGSYTKCTHTIVVHADTNAFPAWSLIYSITPVSLG